MTDVAWTDRNLALEAVRVTEAAALSASRLMGRGDEKAADQAAVDAMRTALNGLAIEGTVVIGEGERDEAPMLFIGEKVGTGHGPKIDIALDPLEGTTITAKGGPNALAVIAMAEHGGFLNAPDVYMDKIAIGAGFGEVVDLDETPATNLKNLAKAKHAEVADLVVCILDRPRHAELIAKVREAGARIMLISDGDVSGVISTSRPASGIDMYVGSGGAPEGVLAAAALRCIGGHMQGRLIFRNDDERGRAQAHRHHRLQSQIRSSRSGQGRRDVRGDRRHQRQHAAGRASLPRRRRHPFHGDALPQRHRPPYRGAAQLQAQDALRGVRAVAVDGGWRSGGSRVSRRRAVALRPALAAARGGRSRRPDLGPAPGHTGDSRPRAGGAGDRGGGRRALPQSDAPRPVAGSQRLHRHGPRHRAPGARGDIGRADRDLRRLRRGRRHLGGAAAAVSLRRGRPRRRLRAGPHEGRLRPQRAGAAEAEIRRCRRWR